MEATLNQETNKPNPISLKEWFLMDTDEQKDFFGNLSFREKNDFMIAQSNYYQELPKAEKQALIQARIDKLSGKKDQTLKDKAELGAMKSALGHAESPKPPKPGGEKGIVAKIRTVSSPYLIRSV